MTSLEAVPGDDPPIIAWTTIVNGLATFSGPGGFTQQCMTCRDARAIAEALGVEFRDESPTGTASEVVA